MPATLAITAAVALTAATTTPFWTHAGVPTTAAVALVEQLQALADDGLDPGDYGVPELAAALQDWPRTAWGRRRGAVAAAAFDAALTRAFSEVAADLHHGRVGPDGATVAVTVDVGAVRERLGRHGDAARALASLRPRSPQYAALRTALVSLNAIVAAGGWPVLPAGPPLEPGQRDAVAVPALRARLLAGGDVSAAAAAVSDVALFDAELAAGLRRAQVRHGIAAAGTLDAATVAALNVPATVRAAQLALALERERWFAPPDPGPRVDVNIADFLLRASEDGQTRLALRAVVGTYFRQTPALESQIAEIVLNPSWTVPRDLALRDVVPRARRDPAVLMREGLRVFRGFGAAAVELDPRTLAWDSFDQNHFPVWLRQDPGPRNPLGRVKFLFANDFDVYVHDTPAQGLFAQQERDFSAGCVRVERAAELAAWLLAQHPHWTSARLRDALRGGGETRIKLPQPVPVRLYYATAFVDAAGVLQWRPDVYGRDAALSRQIDALRSSRQRDVDKSYELD